MELGLKDKVVGITGGAIVFLASDAAGYITGTNLEITGGKLCVRNPELPRRNAARDGGA